MKHKHWFGWLYREGCAPCKVRQLRYGFRMDPVGFMETRDKVVGNTRFTVKERLWILSQVPPIVIEYD